MATPMTADQFLAALRAEGVRIQEHAGWRTHNRAGHGAWGPVNGVMIHHTAGQWPGDASVVWSGRSDLPGPLAHGYLAKSGVVTMTANGRANHAGGGDPKVYAAVVNESPLPAPHYHDGSAGAVDGNAHFYGLEISNLGDGKDPYPAAQYKAAVKWAAAICRFHKWTAKSVIGHKEWSDWKSDPSFDIKKFRSDVAACLAAEPGAWGATAPTKTATAPKEQDMELNSVVTLPAWAKTTWPDDKGVADLKIAVNTALGSTYGHARKARENSDQLVVMVKALAAQVAALEAQVKALKV